MAVHIDDLSHILSANMYITTFVSFFFFVSGTGLLLDMNWRRFSFLMANKMPKFSAEISLPYHQNFPSGDVLEKKRIRNNTECQMHLFYYFYYPGRSPHPPKFLGPPGSTSQCSFFRSLFWWSTCADSYARAYASKDFKLGSKYFFSNPFFQKPITYRFFFV